MRRAVRIIPPMLISYAAAVLLVAGGLLPSAFDASGIIVDLFFLSNYSDLIGVASGIPIPLWSLNIEEHFYMGFPFIFLAVANSVIGRFGKLILIFLFLALLIRFWEYERGNGAGIYYWTHTRFDMILYGVGLAVAARSGVIDRTKRGVGIGALILATMVLLATLLIRDDWFRETIRYSLQGVAISVILYVLLRTYLPVITPLLSSSVAKSVADLSYVLYLIHLPMMMTAHSSATFLPEPLRFLLGAAASFLFAVLVRRFVELPPLAWRKKLKVGLQPVGPLRPKGLE